MGRGGTPSRLLDTCTASSSKSLPIHCCRAEAAFVEALQQAGGVEDAKPRALLQVLAPAFPECSLQVLRMLLCCGNN